MNLKILYAGFDKISQSVKRLENSCESTCIFLIDRLFCRLKKVYICIYLWKASGECFFGRQ
jgi:hypothetical protein